MSNQKWLNSPKSKARLCRVPYHFKTQSLNCPCRLSLISSKSFDKSISEEETTCLKQPRILLHYDAHTAQDLVRQEMKTIWASNILLNSCSFGGHQAKSATILDQTKIVLTSLLELQFDVKKLTNALSDHKNYIKKIEAENYQLVKRKKALQKKLQTRLEAQNQKTIFCNWCII